MNKECIWFVILLVQVIPESRGDFKPKELPTTIKPVTKKPDQRAKLPAPTVNDNCAYGSGAAKSGNLIDGLRFGSQPDSRVEFGKLPARYKNSFDFSVEFNTTSDGGVIFYAADSSHKDFVTLFMKDGKVTKYNTSYKLFGIHIFMYITDSNIFQ